MTLNIVEDFEQACKVFRVKMPHAYRIYIQEEFNRRHSVEASLALLRSRIFDEICNDKTPADRTARLEAALRHLDQAKGALQAK